MEKKGTEKKGEEKHGISFGFNADRCTEAKPVLIHEYEKHKVVWDLFQCNMNSK